jgi:hypothetical protein
VHDRRDDVASSLAFEPVGWTRFHVILEYPRMPRSTHGIRRSVAGAVAAFTLAVAGCTDSASNPVAPQPLAAPDVAALSSSNNDAAHGHVMLIKGAAQLEAYRNASKRPGGGTGISYHGGPVLQAGTHVAAVYWASSPIFNGGPAAGTSGSGTADGSLVGTFLRGLGGSPYFGINSSYTDGAGRAIANSVTYTQYWANNGNAPSGTTSVTDAQMVAMLQSGFNSGALSYDASTVYAIFTSGKVNLGGGFGTQYCAYHTHGTVTVNGVATTVLYAAMPYNYAYPSACTSGYAPANGTTDPGADYQVNTLAHEIEETTTDMLGTAWFDNRGYENADKCAWTWGATYTTSSGGTANMKIGGRDFLVQQNWQNLNRGGCVLHL